jgi:hypothetical protein
MGATGPLSRASPDRCQGSLLWWCETQPAVVNYAGTPDTPQMPPPLYFDTPGQHFDSGLTYDSGVAPGPGPYQNQKKYTTMSKFKLELKKKTVPEKLGMGANHITSMTTNPHYPTATRVPSDAQVQVAQDDLTAAEAAVSAAKTLWKQKIQARDIKEEVWDTVITARSRNCEAVTPNDLDALASTGFPLRTPPVPVGVLPMPTGLEAKTNGFEGQMDLTCDALAGAHSYEWQCRLHTDGTAWSTVKTTTTRKVRPNRPHSGIGLCLPRPRDRHCRPQPLERRDIKASNVRQPPPKRGEGWSNGALSAWSRCWR